jgi:hypothetical protein
MRQLIIDMGPVREGKIGKNLALKPVRKIGAGRDGCHEKPQLMCRDVLGHGVGSDSGNGPKMNGIKAYWT